MCYHYGQPGHIRHSCPNCPVAQTTGPPGISSGFDVGITFHIYSTASLAATHIPQSQQLAIAVTSLPAPAAIPAPTPYATNDEPAYLDS